MQLILLSITFQITSISYIKHYASILEIRAVDLDSIMKDVQPRKYEELRTLFNGIFKYTVASGLIQNNPVALIKFKRAERQNRESYQRTK